MGLVGVVGLQLLLQFLQDDTMVIGGNWRGCGMGCGHRWELEGVWSSVGTGRGVVWGVVISGNWRGCGMGVVIGEHRRVCGMGCGHLWAQEGMGCGHLWAQEGMGCGHLWAQEGMGCGHLWALKHRRRGSAIRACGYW